MHTAENRVNALTPLSLPNPLVRVESRRLGIFDSTSETVPRVRSRGCRTTVALTFLTAAAMSAAAAEGLSELRDLTGGGALGRVVLLSLLSAAAIALISNHLMYEVARYGFLRRQGGASEPDTETSGLQCASGPRVTIVIPVYREEGSVVRRAILSSALQLYGSSEIVVLLDDEEGSEGSDVIRTEARAIEAAFALQARHVERARKRFESTRRWIRAADETLALASLLEDTGNWLHGLADEYLGESHEGRVFAREVLLEPGRELLAQAEAARTTVLSPDEMLHSYQMLADWLTPRISVLQRKRYANLTHASNKASNLNAFLELRGARWRETETDVGRMLVAVGPRAKADFDFADPRYVMCLDCDSFVVPRYLTVMVEVLEAAGNERLAIAQSPYRAIPGPPSRVEQLAGATTDVQHLVHLGLGYFGAAFWVGANAVIRVAALEDIAVPYEERGFNFRKYITDRTVIEDSDASMALVARGWAIHNHPRALAYSATPSDFGALVVQRRRWSNGGILILPAVLALALRRPRHVVSWMLRGHYLASTAVAGLGVPMLAFGFVVAYPFGGDVRSPWLALAALPGFALYSADLRRFGHRRRDVFGIYALNLALLPAYLGGTLRSLQQALTGKRTVFGRTPKVEYRTALPPTYVIAQWAMLLFVLAGATTHAAAGRWVYASFLGANATALGWALFVLVGVRASATDFGTAVARRSSSLRTPVRGTDTRRVLPRAPGPIWYSAGSADPIGLLQPDTSSWYPAPRVGGHGVR